MKKKNKLFVTLKEDTSICSRIRLLAEANIRVYKSEDLDIEKGRNQICLSISPNVFMRSKKNR